MPQTLFNWFFIAIKKKKRKEKSFVCSHRSKSFLDVIFVRLVFFSLFPYMIKNSNQISVIFKIKKLYTSKRCRMLPQVYRGCSSSSSFCALIVFGTALHSSVQFVCVCFFLLWLFFIKNVIRNNNTSHVNTYTQREFHLTRFATKTYVVKSCYLFIYTSAEYGRAMVRWKTMVGAARQSALKQEKSFSIYFPSG